MRGGVLTTGVALLAVVGCSLTARERLKKFFFELPDEPAIADAVEPGSGERAAPAEDRPAPPLAPVRFASIHEPFRSRDCQACHDANARMRVERDAETTCGACHDRYFGQEVGHGPVAGGDCLLCHDPHRSAFPALLLTTIGENCTQCHETADELSQPAHSGAEAVDCTKCHDPHFGEPPLLKPGVRRP